MTGPFRFEAELWRHRGEAAWYFVTLPDDVSDEIAELTEPDRRGFGSVRVTVTIGGTTWRTSLFPDAKAGAYVLPVKRAVRAAESIGDGDLIAVVIELDAGAG